jgi:hypothetical protein
MVREHLPPEGAVQTGWSCQTVDECRSGRHYACAPAPDESGTPQRATKTPVYQRQLKIPIKGYIVHIEITSNVVRSNRKREKMEIK